jgi:hypothetical protein
VRVNQVGYATGAPKVAFAMLPAKVARVIDVPPVAGAALLGLDHVKAPPAAESRLRAAYDAPRS